MKIFQELTVECLVVLLMQHMVSHEHDDRNEHKVRARVYERVSILGAGDQRQRRAIIIKAEP